jgi:hypothetical protein
MFPAQVPDQQIGHRNRSASTERQTDLLQPAIVGVCQNNRQRQNPPYGAAFLKVASGDFPILLETNKAPLEPGIELSGGQPDSRSSVIDFERCRLDHHAC